MKYYFQLQSRVLSRKFRFAGIHPVLGFAIVAAVFLIFTNIVLQRLEHGAIAVALIPFLLAFQLSGKRRNDHLALIFEDRELKLLRLLENQLVSLPFTAILVFNGSWQLALILLIIVGLVSLIAWKSSFHSVIPTPFSSRPFEFSRGFRITLPLTVVVLILTGLAAWSGNGNVGFLALLIAVFVLVFNYSKLEPEAYVWNFQGTFESFIWSKVKTLLLFSSLALLPIVVVLSGLYPDLLPYFFLVIPVSWIYLFMALLAKYSCFPKPMNTLYEIIFSIGILIPFATPFLLVLFWKRAKINLETVLS